MQRAAEPERRKAGITLVSFMESPATSPPGAQGPLAPLQRAQSHGRGFLFGLREWLTASCTREAGVPQPPKLTKNTKSSDS